MKCDDWQIIITSTTLWNRQIIFVKYITLHLLDIYSVSTWTNVAWESDFTTFISILKLVPSFKNWIFTFAPHPHSTIKKKNILLFTVIVIHIYIPKIICFCKVGVGFLQKQEVYNKHIYFSCLYFLMMNTIMINRFIRTDNIILFSFCLGIVLLFRLFYSPAFFSVTFSITWTKIF